MFDSFGQMQHKKRKKRDMKIAKDFRSKISVRKLFWLYLCSGADLCSALGGIITEISHFLSKFQLWGDALKVKQKVDFKFVDKMPAAGGKFQKFHCF